MAVAQILAVGAGTASSSEFVVAIGETVGVVLNDAAGPAVAHGAAARIEVKDPAGNFFEVGAIVSDVNGLRQSTVLVAPGTYRATRLGAVACGVFITR